MTDALIEMLDNALGEIGTLPLAESWMYQTIRHCERNMDFDLYEGDSGNEPNRQSGEAIARVLNALPDILAALRTPKPEVKDSDGLVDAMRDEVVALRRQGNHEKSLAMLEAANVLEARIATLTAEARPAVDGLRDDLARAYVQGARDVHRYWQANPGEAPRGDGEFGEAGYDYADAALDPVDSAALATTPAQGDKQ